VPEPDCGLVDFGCKASAALDDAFTDLANKLIAGLGQATTSLATFWMSAPTPEVATPGPGGGDASGTVNFLEGSLRWLVLSVAVLSVLVAAIRMALERRAEPGKQLVQSLARLIAVSGAGLTVLQLCITAGEAYSTWILGRSTDNFGEDLVAMLNLGPGDVENATMTVIIIIGVALTALVINVVQIILLVARGGLLVLLAGSWQLSAAATNTAIGRNWFDKITGWLLAFTLYKPTAATIYAASFQMVGNADGGDKLTESTSGIALHFLSLLALPALLRLMVPAVSAVSGGGGGGLAAAGTVAAMAMPSGSAVVPRGATRGAAAGGTGGPGAPGAPGGPGPSGSPTAGGGGPSGGPSGGPGGSGTAAGGGVATLTRGAAVAQVLGQNTASGAGAPDQDDDGGPSGSK